LANAIAPPRGDRGVVAGGQDRGHDALAWLARATGELERPGVLRIFEQPRAVGFVIDGARLAEHAGHVPRDRVDHDQRGELAAREHVVADRELFVDRRLDHALVDAFIAATDQDDVRQRRQLPHAGLGQRRPGRRDQDAVSPATAARAACTLLRASWALDQARRGLLDRREQRLGLHHHARPAAVRRVIDGAVPIGREVARVDGVDGDHAGFAGPADHAGGERRPDQLGEDRDDRELHPVTSGARGGLPADRP
jgi:hypothetical protein